MGSYALLVKLSFRLTGFGAMCGQRCPFGCSIRLERGEGNLIRLCVSLDRVSVVDQFGGLAPYCSETLERASVVVDHTGSSRFCSSNLLFEYHVGIWSHCGQTYPIDAMNRRSIADRFESLAVLLCNIGTGLCEIRRCSAPP